MTENSFFDGQLELSDLLSHVLDKGVVLKGEVMLSVADIDLVRLDLGLLLTAVETAMRREGNRRPPLLSTRLASLDPVPAVTLRNDAGDAPAASPATAAVSPAGGTVSIEELAPALPKRIDADPEKTENGLARLVLTLIEVLRKVLEHQAVRRMEGGHLSEEEIERLGVALLRLSDRMKDMQGIFGLTDEDLEIDLGPLGRLR